MAYLVGRVDNADTGVLDRTSTTIIPYKFECGILNYRLVPDLLQSLVGSLPLPSAEEIQAAGQRKAKPTKLTPAAAAAAAAQDRLEGKLPDALAWNLRTTLLQLDSLDSTVLAPLLYRYHLSDPSRRIPMKLTL